MDNSTLPSEFVDFRFLHLAKRLEADIKAKKLKSGDLYLTTAECARMLEVNTSAANKALQMLSMQGLLRRTRRVGTVITDPPANHSPLLLQTIHLIIELHSIPSHHMALDELLIGLQGVFPLAKLSVKVLPVSGDVVFLKRLLRHMAQANGLEAVVLLSSSVDLQRLCVESGLPAVSLGLPQPSMEALSAMDQDARLSGLLLARHLLEKKPRSLMILTREWLTPSDHKLLDGIFEVLTAQQFPLSDINLQCVEVDELAVRAEVDGFLENFPGPHAFLVLVGEHAAFADAALRIPARRKARLLALADCHFQHPILNRHAHLRFQWSSREIGDHLGVLLRKIALGQVDPGVCLTLPVNLVQPDCSPPPTRHPSSNDPAQPKC